MFSWTEHPAHLLHKDGNPQNDEYINVDVRVMGRTILCGWIQLL